MTNNDMRQVLRDACEEAGGQASWARKHGFSEGFVSQCVSGKKRMAPRMAEALGYRCELNFTRMAKADTPSEQRITRIRETDDE